MAIRKATLGDVRAMAEAAAAAFMEEELFGKLMHPHRKEYPEDFVHYFEGKFVKHWDDPNHHFLVGLEKETGRVVAVADWERQGERPGPEGAPLTSSSGCVPDGL